MNEICSICGAVPAVQIDGTYWLCGPCVSERLTAEQQKQCPDCDGNGWHAAGETDNPQQVQCTTCQSTGRLLLPTNAAPPQDALDAKPREQLMKQMVDAFLSWPLPSTFAPDCGISFDGSWVDARGALVSWPIGTNLFTAREAQLMVEHMFAVADAAMQGKRHE